MNQRIVRIAGPVVALALCLSTTAVASASAPTQLKAVGVSIRAGVGHILPAGPPTCCGGHHE